MVLHRIDTLESYLHYVQENAGEVADLFRDLLINVTSFFRNPEQLEALRERVFPEVVTLATREKPLRIWVPGCATGEEAYSIAMALLEYIEGTDQGRDIPTHPATSTRSDPTQEADNMMLDRYAPLGVVVNEDMNIIYTRGSSDRFLELPLGRASLNVFKMARGNLEYELRTLIRRAEKGEVPARKENVEIGRASCRERV